MSRPILVVSASRHAGGAHVAHQLAHHPDVHPVHARALGGTASTGVRTPDRARSLSLIDAPHDLDPLIGPLPEVDVVLVVREGLDTIAAARRDGIGFETAMHEWRTGTRAILTLIGKPLLPRVRVQLVHYERFVEEPVGTGSSLAAWLGLPSAAGPIGWTKVVHDARNDSGSDLTALERARFACASATHARALGYPVPPIRPALAPLAVAIEVGFALHRAFGRLLA
ncbi:MAG: hypothetical protein KY469_11405 [Actinobacteria bacterium]|nr:hypothetical protein [Actinomycetota bacterium]